MVDVVKRVRSGDEPQPELKLRTIEWSIIIRNYTSINHKAMAKGLDLLHNHYTTNPPTSFVIFVFTKCSFIFKIYYNITNANLQEYER